MQTFKNIAVLNFGPFKKGDTTDNIAFEYIDPEFPAGLNGALVTMQLQSPSTRQVVKTFSSAVNGGLLVSNQNTFNLVPYKIDFAAGCYNFEIQITYPQDIVKTRIAGTYTVTNDIVKNA